MDVVLYQTLDDRENPDEVEDHGPFKCTRNDAWLGHGYYFWEGHIELAHFWGNGRDKYIICQAKATIDDSCYDLYNKSELRIEFGKICDRLVQYNIADESNLLVSQVIEFIKSKGQFKYSSIRVSGTDSITNKYENESFIRRLRFKKGQFQYFDMIPPIQICLLSKNSLSLRNFLIVYPTEYVSDYYA